MDTVDENHRVDRIQRPVLPLAHDPQHPVGDRRDVITRHRRAVHLGQMRAHLTSGQPFGGQADHQIVDAAHPPLPLGHDLRGETGVPVAWHAHPDRADLGQQRLGPAAVTAVGAITTGRLVLAVAEMLVHLRCQRGLQEPFGQLLQQPVAAQQRHALRPASRATSCGSNAAAAASPLGPSGWCSTAGAQARPWPSPAVIAVLVLVVTGCLLVLYFGLTPS